MLPVQGHSVPYGSPINDQLRAPPTGKWQQGHLRGQSLHLTPRRIRTSRLRQRADRHSLCIRGPGISVPRNSARRSHAHPSVRPMGPTRRSTSNPERARTGRRYEVGPTPASWEGPAADGFLALGRNRNIRRRSVTGLVARGSRDRAPADSPGGSVGPAGGNTQTRRAMRASFAGTCPDVVSPPHTGKHYSYQCRQQAASGMGRCQWGQWRSCERELLAPSNP